MKSFLFLLSILVLQLSGESVAIANSDFLDDPYEKIGIKMAMENSMQWSQDGIRSTGTSGPVDLSWSYDYEKNSFSFALPHPQGAMGYSLGHGYYKVVPIENFGIQVSIDKVTKELTVSNVYLSYRAYYDTEKTKDTCENAAECLESEFDYENTALFKKSCEVKITKADLKINNKERTVSFEKIACDGMLEIKSFVKVEKLFKLVGIDTLPSL